jgi:hypothetical protein
VRRPPGTSVTSDRSTRWYGSAPGQFLRSGSRLGTTGQPLGRNCPTVPDRARDSSTADWSGASRLGNRASCPRIWSWPGPDRGDDGRSNHGTDAPRSSPIKGVAAGWPGPDGPGPPALSAEDPTGGSITSQSSVTTDQPGLGGGVPVAVNAR